MTGLVAGLLVSTLELFTVDVVDLDWVSLVGIDGLVEGVTFLVGSGFSLAFLGG